MAHITTYTLPALAEATGISEDTLRTWKSKGWLQPYAVSGNRHYYRMEEFDEAARLSVQDFRKSHQPEVDEDDPSIYDRIAQKYVGSPRPEKVRERITRKGAAMKN